MPNKPSYILIFVISILLSASFAEPVFAIVPEVRNVVVYNVGNSTFLNITIYHYPEDGSIPHYVDTIRVTVDANTTDLTIGPQPLSPNDTFIIAYELGPVEGTPTATVQAHCIVNGWSEVNWTGQVPEFSTSALLLTLILVTSLAVFVFRKIKPNYK